MQRRTGLTSGGNRLPDPAGIHRDHGFARGAAKGLAELVEVLHRAIHAPAAGRVRISQRHLASYLLGLVLAPYLGKAEEVALGLGVAIDLVVDGFALRRQGVKQSHVGDAKAAVVSRVFAQGELAVQILRRYTVMCRGGLKAAVFSRFAVGPLDEFLTVLDGLPLAQVAFAVVL